MRLFRSPSHPARRASLRGLVVVALTPLFAFLALVALGSLFAASPARAHGPTVELTEKGLEPVLLNLFEGTTVHFSNTLTAPEGLVVVDESGLLESPPLKLPGDGWHFTFDKAGRYVIRVRERPDASMRIVVVPKRTP